MACSPGGGPISASSRAHICSTRTGCDTQRRPRATSFRGRPPTVCYAVIVRGSRETSSMSSGPKAGVEEEAKVAAVDTAAEVETPEHIRFRYDIAGPARRFFAYFL